MDEDGGEPGAPAPAPTVPQVAAAHVASCHKSPQGKAGCRIARAEPRPEAMEPADEGEEMRRSGEEER